MSYLALENKSFLVLGVANKKSVAYAIARGLEEEGARVIYSVQSEEHRTALRKLLPEREIHVCDVAKDEQIRRLADEVGKGLGEKRPLADGRGSDEREVREDPPLTPPFQGGGCSSTLPDDCISDQHHTLPHGRVSDIYPKSVIRNPQLSQSSVLSPQSSKLAGIVHSIAFANYENFSGKFHEVSRRDFLQAVDVSCYSLIAVANAFKDLLEENASVVTISISTTEMAAESYGYMAPVKAALDSTVTFLAKSFSQFSKVRFNAVCAGPLKTSASAGIPNYMDNYLFAEQATLRKKALTTEEVANVAMFLLSERSSGINAGHIVVDAGMSKNYFDSEIVKHTISGIFPTKQP